MSDALAWTMVEVGGQIRSLYNYVMGWESSREFAHRVVAERNAKFLEKTKGIRIEGAKYNVSSGGSGVSEHLPDGSIRGIRNGHAFSFNSDNTSPIPINVDDLNRLKSLQAVAAKIYKPTGYKPTRKSDLPQQAH